MEVVKSAEQVALAGEVTFTESVNLARNRAEVVAEPCGTIPLPGRAESLRAYRSKHRPRRERPSGAGPGQCAHGEADGAPGEGQGPAPEAGAADELPKHRLAGLGLAGGALLLAGVGLWLWSRSPEVQARRLLAEGKPAEALKRLDAVPAGNRRRAEAARSERWRCTDEAARRRARGAAGVGSGRTEGRGGAGAGRAGGGLRSGRSGQGAAQAAGRAPEEPAAQPLRVAGRGGRLTRSSGERCATWRRRRTRRGWTWWSCTRRRWRRRTAACEPRQRGGSERWGARTRCQRSRSGRAAQATGSKNCGQDEAAAALQTLKKSHWRGVSEAGCTEGSSARRSALGSCQPPSSPLRTGPPHARPLASHQLQSSRPSAELRRVPWIPRSRSYARPMKRVISSIFAGAGVSAAAGLPGWKKPSSCCPSTPRPSTCPPRTFEENHRCRG